MQRESLEKLEFYKIIDEIASYSHSEATRKTIKEITPYSNSKSIINRCGNGATIAKIVLRV